MNVAFRKYIGSGKIIAVLLESKDNNKYKVIDESGTESMLTGLYINQNTVKCDYRSFEYIELYATLQEMGYDIEYDDLRKVESKREIVKHKYSFPIWICDSDLLFENPYRDYCLKFSDNINGIPITVDNAEKLIEQLDFSNAIEYDIPECHYDYDNFIDALNAYSSVKLVKEIKI